MPTQQIERIGDFMTMREAAKLKGCTPNALYLWLRYNDVPQAKVGQTTIVRQSDIVGYTPRKRQQADLR